MPETATATTGFSLEKANADLASATPQARIEWAVGHFGDGLMLSTSFGVQSAVMLHLATQVKADIPVIFIDTGYLFPETYRFAQELTERLSLNLKVYQPLRTAAWQEALHGKRWEMGLEELEAYNRENKVEPMNRALQELGATAWLAGLRRTQSSTRKGLPVLLRQNRMFKVHPIIDWSDRDIYQYLKQHDLPYHPLWHEGYVSIGDWHSTKRLEDGMSEEETRFNGMKRECGLHEVSHKHEFFI